MGFISLILIVVVLLILIIKNRKNKEKLKETVKNNIIKIIVICFMISITFFIIENFLSILSEIQEYVDYGYEISLDITNFTPLILYILSIVILIFNKKLSKNRILIVTTIIIYVLIMIIVPVAYLNAGHQHITEATPENVPEGMDEDNILYDFYAYSETIVEYKNYYNVFTFPIFTGAVEIY